MAPKNIITVDWEDWFHICEVDHLLPRSKWDSYPSILPEATEVLLQFFATNQICATFFILGYCAKRYPELVQKIQDAGHEIAYHTENHNLIYEQDPQVFQTDIRQGKAYLEQLCNTEVKGFRAPQWSINERNPWGLELLCEEGYSYDSSHTPLRIIGNPCYPEYVHHLQTAHGVLQEFPPLVLNILGLKVPAGGGWGLKTWPLAAIKAKMKKLNDQGSPVTFFIHPVDVVDFMPPVQLPLLKKIVTQFGLRKTAQAIKSLTNYSEFISIRQYMEHSK